MKSLMPPCAGRLHSGRRQIAQQFQIHMQPTSALAPDTTNIARRTALALLLLALDSSPIAAQGIETAARFPRLLAGYHIRPAWEVAGVDYAVGLPSNVRLTNPAEIQRSGVMIDRTNHLIRIVADNISLSGYDFSLDGGWGVYVMNARNTTIENSYFAVGHRAVVPIVADSRSVGLTVRTSTIDGGAISHPGRAHEIYTLINFLGSGIVVIENNWLKNAPQHVIEFKDGTLHYRRNLIWGMGFFKEAHPNAVQFNASKSSGSTISFNTFISGSPEGSPPMAVGEVVQVEAQLGSMISDVKIDHNLIIARGHRIIASYLIAIRAGGPDNRVERVRVENNFLDPSGAYGPFYPLTGTDIALSNNRSLITGRLLEAPKPKSR